MIYLRDCIYSHLTSESSDMYKGVRTAQLEMWGSVSVLNLKRVTRRSPGLEGAPLSQHLGPPHRELFLRNNYKGKASQVQFSASPLPSLTFG